jgi:hypothetical protein
MIVDLWSANTKLAINRLVGDYSREVGFAPVNFRFACHSGTDRELGVTLPLHRRAIRALTSA